MFIKPLKHSNMNIIPFVHINVVIMALKQCHFYFFYILHTERVVSACHASLDAAWQLLVQVLA